MRSNQVTISVDAARRLIAAQFPPLATLPVTSVDSAGTVNAIFRIGDDLVARFPLQGSDPELVRGDLEAEAAAAGELAGRTRFATPRPVGLGDPGEGYPLPWSVQTWIAGSDAIQADPGGSVPFAEDLAEFIAGVRSIDTRGRTFSGRGRGGDLKLHDAWVETSLRRSEGMLDVYRLRELWASMRELPRDNPSDVMNHSDLMPGNVLVSEGRLSGVLDVGGLAPADPALDLVAAWHLLEEAPREAFRRELNCSDNEWARGRAWAFQQAIGLVWYYADSNPTMTEIGRRTLDRILSACH